MDNHSSGFKIKLGMFVAGGFVLLLATIFIIGRQKNLFNPIFRISAKFSNVSGLKVGNNIRFSGINVGTVDKIIILNDTTVLVKMIVQKDVQEYIRTDCEVTIGSDGIIGDKMLNITQGSNEFPQVKDGGQLKSIKPVDMDDIMAGIGTTVKNAGVITDELTKVMYRINKGKGTIGRLIADSSIAENLSQTVTNLKRGTKGLDENMEAAKHNFLFRGYYKKKAKEEKKKAEEAKEKAEEGKK